LASSWCRWRILPLVSHSWKILVFLLFFCF
jgi:hypothetical protein